MPKLRSAQPKRKQAAEVMSRLERQSLVDCLARLMHEEYPAQTDPPSATKNVAWNN